MAGRWEFLRLDEQSNEQFVYVGQKFGWGTRVNPYIRCFYLVEDHHKTVVKVLVGCSRKEDYKFADGHEEREVKKDNTFSFYNRTFKLTEEEIKQVEALRAQIPPKVKPRKLTPEERYQQQYNHYLSQLRMATVEIEKWQKKKRLAESALHRLQNMPK